MNPRSILLALLLALLFLHAGTSPLVIQTRIVTGVSLPHLGAALRAATTPYAEQEKRLARSRLLRRVKYRLTWIALGPGGPGRGNTNTGPSSRGKQ